MKYLKIFENFEIIEEKKKHPNQTEERIRNSFYRKEILRDKLESEIFSFLAQNEDKHSQRLVLWDGSCRVCYKEKKKCTKVSSTKMFWFKKKVRKVQLKSSRITCTYDSGESCRYPGSKRYSMEATGIHVDQTVRKLGFKIEWPPTHYIYRFSLVCFK